MRFTAIGQATGLSPERMRAVERIVLTNSNPWVNAAGRVMDKFGYEQMPDELKYELHKQIGSVNYENQQKTDWRSKAFTKRFVGYGNVYPSNKSSDKAIAVTSAKKEGNNKLVETFIQNNELRFKSSEDGIKLLAEHISKLNLAKPNDLEGDDITERARLFERYLTELAIPMYVDTPNGSISFNRSLLKYSTLSADEAGAGLYAQFSQLTRPDDKKAFLMDLYYTNANAGNVFGGSKAAVFYRLVARDNRAILEGMPVIGDEDSGETQETSTEEN